MAQDNIFGHLLPASPAPTRQPAMPSQDPIVRRADPYKAEDQQFQRNAEIRAQQDQALQMQRLQMEREKDERQKVQDQQGTESERTAGYLTGRMKDAVGRLAASAKKDASALAPTLGVEAVRGIAGDTAANFFTDADRQIVRAAQYDILDAALTLGTGAAYTKEQIEGYRQSYFPQIFDDAATVQSKNEALRQLLANARVKAGRAAPDVDAAIAALNALDIPVVDGQPEEEPGLSGSVTDDTPWPKQPGNNVPPSGGNGGGGSFWQGIGAGVGDLVEGGVNNTVGLIVNPINTVAGRAMGYEGYASDIGQTIRDALQLPEGNQTVSAINQAAAGGLSVGGLSRKAGQVLGNASLRAFGNNPLLDAATGATAAASGEVARQSGAGPVGQSVATLAGGFAPSAAIGGRNALLGVMGRNPPRGPAPDMAVIEAGQRQGVPIRQPDARPELRGDYAALESKERAGQMISAARASDAEAIATRANEVTGGNAFDRADNTALGQAVQKTAERAEADVKGVAKTLYKRAEREAPDFSTPATQTSAFIDSKIAELRAASPTGYNAEISALEGMKSDLAQTGLSVRTLQAQRETVGGRIGDNIQDRSRADRTFTEVLKVAGDELHGALRSANPRAAEILKRADAKWGQYKRLQKEVTGLFLGKRGNATAETAARNLNATARNNYSALRRFMTMATPEEKADFAATFVQNWGATARGDFSPAIYAKSMESVSDRTLDALVGAEGRKALRDLQVISNAKTDAMGRMAPSGKAISGMKGGLRTLMLSTLGLSQGGIGGAVLLPAAANLFAKIGEERAARLMLNPDFTKWLRAMPEATNPKAINAYFGKLKASAARSQVAANDVEAFTAAVMEAFAQSPRRAAAQQEDN